MKNSRPCQQVVAKLRKLVVLSSTFAIAPFAAIAGDESEASLSQTNSVLFETGSRIKQSIDDQSSQIIVIDRHEIERSGESSAADLLRNLSLNSRGSFRPQSGSSIQGVAELDLYGIGSGNTLLLIDGRRMTKNAFTGDSHDLTTIALASIERIEIIPKGASATYGANAVAGVVNIIT
jgi:iron complex outermembrane receptor protein